MLFTFECTSSVSFAKKKKKCTIALQENLLYFIFYIEMCTYINFILD